MSTKTGLEPPFLDDTSIPERIVTEEVTCCVCGSAHGETVATAWDYEYRTSRQPWLYKRCASCGHVYLAPRPATSELGTIYPSNYYSFDEAKRTNPLVSFFRGKLEAMKTKVFGRFVGSGQKRILDVGCGDGRFMSCLVEYGDPAWQVSGIDIDEGAIARARAKGLSATVTRLEDLEPGDQRYHMIVLFQVIEHVSDPRAMVAKIKDLLEPGGVFVIETPDVAGWDEKWFRSGLWGGYHVPRHWNLFTPDNLERLLTEEGFTVEATEPLISTSFWINSLYNRALIRGAGERTLKFFDYQNPILLAVFIVLDKLRMAFGARTSNQRVIARRAD